MAADIVAAAVAAGQDKAYPSSTGLCVSNLASPIPNEAVHSHRTNNEKPAADRMAPKQLRPNERVLTETM